MIVNDSIMSLTTSLGEQVANIKYTSNKKLSVRELSAMYDSSFIAKKYIDKTVADMLKLQREFDGDIDPSDIERDFALDEVYKLALTWASLYGDSLVVAVTDVDIEEFSQPLKDNESIVRFIVLAANEYTPSGEVDADITSPNFGKPLGYQLKVGAGIEVHHSRCHLIRLGNQKISDKSRNGTSDLQAPYSAIKIFEAAVISIGDIIKDSNVDIISMQGLFQKLAAGQCDHVATYALMMKQQKSSSGMVMIDSEDSYDQKQSNYSGLSEVIDKMLSVLAGALDRPITVLFGQSASGFATGEEDNRAYYETIKSLQESRLRPLQEFIDSFFPELKDQWFEYPSIDSVNEKENAEIFSSVTTALGQLLMNDAISDRDAIVELQRLGFLTGVNVDEKEDEYEEDESSEAFEAFGSMVSGADRVIG